MPLFNVAKSLLVVDKLVVIIDSVTCMFNSTRITYIAFICHIHTYNITVSTKWSLKQCDPNRSVLVDTLVMKKI